MFFEIGITVHIEKYLSRNSEEPSFVLGAMTVIDFQFANTIFFVLGMYGALCPEIATGHWKERTCNHRPSAQTV